MARHATAALVVAMTAGACASSGGETSDNGSDNGSDDDTEPSLIEAARRLEGRYAHFDVVAYENTEMKNLIISFGISDLEIRDGELWTSQEFCHADQVTDQPIQTSISDAATQAILPIATPVQLSEEDGLLRVRRPPTPTPVGIEMADPANEELPSDPDDPRIVDADGDGNPGITVTVKFSEDSGGDIYLARREIFAYDLIESGLGDGALVGSVTDSSEQLIIGATNELLLTSAQWDQNPDPAKSPITWTPIAADTDCESLMAARDEIFPPNPVVDW